MLPLPEAILSADKSGGLVIQGPWLAKLSRRSCRQMVIIVSFRIVARRRGSNPHGLRGTKSTSTEQGRELLRLAEDRVCAEDAADHFNQNLHPLPQADKPDF